MFTYQNILLPYSIICCIILFKKVIREPDIEKSGSQTFKNIKLKEKLSSLKKHESTQSKHEFCNEALPPNLFKQ